MRTGILVLLCWGVALGGMAARGGEDGAGVPRAAELNRFFLETQGTPAEYAGRKLRSLPIRCAQFRLEPQEIRDMVDRLCPDDDEAKRRLVRLEGDIRRGLAWRGPVRAATIPRLTAAPAIDGHIGDGEWPDKPLFHGEIPLDAEGVAPTGGARWYAAYDAEFLYFAADFPDRDLQCRADAPFLADSLEVFILPDAALEGYWEIVVSPDNDVFSAWHQPGDYGTPNTRAGLRPRTMSTAARRTVDGYSVEMRFPFSAMATLSGTLPARGASLSFMCVRTNRDGDRLSVAVPVPLLYGGHNIRGHIRGVLE